MLVARLRRNCALDATRIAPGIYQGSRPPVGPDVARCGFHALVLAAEEYQPRSHEIPGVVVIHAGIDDGKLDAHTWNTAAAAATEAAKIVRRGGAVLVTCQQGRNRSGLVVALAIRALTGKKGMEIVRLVQRQRNRDLAPGAGALTNVEFVRGLVERLR